MHARFRQRFDTSPSRTVLRSACKSLVTPVVSLTSSGEQNEISIGITHDERSGAPGFRTQRLNKLDARLLIFEKQRLGILERDRRREQLFGVAPRGIDDRVIDLAKIQSGAIAKHLAV